MRNNVRLILISSLLAFTLSANAIEPAAEIAAKSTPAKINTIPEIVNTQSHLNLSNNSVFQVSTFKALSLGDFEGDFEINDIKHHGNFGFGAINGLDGEFIAINGQFFQITADGRSLKLPSSIKTPFAVVTFFKPEQQFTIDNVNNLEMLEKIIDRHLPNPNIPYAIRIKGNFNTVKLCNFTKQFKPYTTLAQVRKSQKEYSLKNSKGNLVGFKFPNYFNRLNVPGYHFHYITSSRDAGGHVLDSSLSSATVYLEPMGNLNIYFPQTSSFASKELSKN